MTRKQQIKQLHEQQMTVFDDLLTVIRNQADDRTIHAVRNTLNCIERKMYYIATGKCPEYSEDKTGQRI